MRGHSRVVSTLLAAATATSMGVVAAPAAHAATPPSRTTITVDMSSTNLSIEGDSTRHAGTINFRAVALDGDHVLQVVRLHPGYTIDQLGADVAAGLEAEGMPDLDAVHRLDTDVTWYGGAEATPGNVGEFSVNLRDGQYVLLDQNGPGGALLTLTGPSKPAVLPHSSEIKALNEAFGSRENIPASGRTLFRDVSDEPHFLVFQHVADGTTAADVKAFFDSGSEGEPSWLREGSTTTGVISPDVAISFHYNLPKGRYLILCWWPDDETGMPHAMMGMWKLVNLR